MEEEGYPREFSASVNITSSTTGLLIPPSNILIVYALASGGAASVAALFVAGYLPGILVGMTLMGYIAFVATNKNFKRGRRATTGEIWKYFRSAFFSLLLLVIVVGGIVAGLFTATEASAIAVLYAALLSLIYGDISTRDFPDILLSASKTTAVVMFLISTSMAMSWLFSFQGIPQMISGFLMEQFSDKIIIFLVINLVLLVIGTFMDITPAVLIFTPIFLPVVMELGMDPVHFGIVMVLNLCIGLCTPPVGTILFVGSGVAQVSVSKVIKPLLAFIGIMLLVLLVVLYVPEISLFLPSLFGL
jgi:tripartite ATP-independent transporter DctM subunit